MLKLLNNDYLNVNTAIEVFMFSRILKANLINIDGRSNGMSSHKLTSWYKTIANKANIKG